MRAIGSAISSKASSILAEKIIFGSHKLAGPIQIAIQHMVGGPREATFEIKTGPAAGMLFSCLTSHKYFFVRGNYESDLAVPIQSLVRAGSVVFDIGAHFGYWTLALSRLCGTTGTVFAFEPSPENLERLRQNLQINEIHNVQVICAAVSDVDGKLQFSEAGSQSAVGSGRVEVDAITLDAFCQAHPKPDFLLIDVEGHAGQVLRGADRIFRERPVPVLCEVHDQSEYASYCSFVDGRLKNVRRLDKSMQMPFRILAT